MRKFKGNIVQENVITRADGGRAEKRLLNVNGVKMSLKSIKKIQQRHTELT